MILANSQQVSEKAHGLPEKKLLSTEAKREHLGQVLVSFPFSLQVCAAFLPPFFLPILSFPHSLSRTCQGKLLGVYVELQAPTCSTSIFKHMIHGIQEANKVLLEIKHIHAHTPTALLSNTTVLIKEIILVSSLKVSSN